MTFRPAESTWAEAAEDLDNETEADRPDNDTALALGIMFVILVIGVLLGRWSKR